MPQTIRTDKYGMYLRCAGHIYRPLFPMEYPPKERKSLFSRNDRVQCDPRIGTPLTVLSAYMGHEHEFVSETWFSHGAYMKPDGTYKESEQCYKPSEYTWAGRSTKQKVIIETPYLSDDDGTFEPWEVCTKTCFNCAGEHVQKRYWVSNDDKYEDEQFRCDDCGHTWWIDEDLAILSGTINKETKSA